MGEINEGDWVVSKEGAVGLREILDGVQGTFLEDMVLIDPIQVVSSNTFASWFVPFNGDVVMYYHPDWLIKVNKDGTTYKWSWLSELGWGEE